MCGRFATLPNEGNGSTLPPLTWACPANEIPLMHVQAVRVFPWWRKLSQRCEEGRFFITTMTGAVGRDHASGCHGGRDQ